MKTTVVANSNIALVKYWGKRDKNLILPNNGSISVTLDGLNTTTTVEFSSRHKKDYVSLNGKEASGKDLEDVIKHLDRARQMAKINDGAKVASFNNFPTAAGLASSASGFAALSAAAAKAAGLVISEKELSMLSRLGSGSASRSVYGGFVEWKKGSKTDGSDSFAEQIFPEGHWPEFRVITAITELKEKKIKSRAGMEQTVNTSPFYNGWLQTVEKDLSGMRKGLKERDLSLVGKVAEANCLKMHATMITTNPPLVYWNGGTIEAMNAVFELRDSGTECYFTIDAGPQVKVICLEKESNKIKKRLAEIENIKEVKVCKVGCGVKFSGI